MIRFAGVIFLLSFPIINGNQIRKYNKNVNFASQGENQKFSNSKEWHQWNREYGRYYQSSFYVLKECLQRPLMFTIGNLWIQEFSRNLQYSYYNHLAAYIIESIEIYDNLDIYFLLQLCKHLNVIFSQSHCLLFLRIHQTKRITFDPYYRHGFKFILNKKYVSHLDISRLEIVP